MRTAAVIGWPVAHSKSPVIHRFWLEALALDGDYARLPVVPERLEQAMAGLAALGLAGVNVTVPHKIAVMPYLHRVDPVARAVGAVNTIIVEDDGLRGLNTDVAGFLEPISGHNIRTAAVIGAGGAARAILVGLAQIGVEHVTIFNRSEHRARLLLEGIGLSGEVQPLDAQIGSADLLVNASSLGMTGQPRLNVDLSALPTTAIVYDIVYAPLQTDLLQQAAHRGLRVIDGLHMLIGQAAPAFELFFGAAPPRARDAELRARLVGGRA